MDGLISIDLYLTSFLRNFIPHSLFFNSFFSFFSLKGSSILIWLLVILIVVILEERKNPGITKQDKRFIILFSLSFLLSFFLSDIILKNIFLRPRPIQLIQPILTCPHDFSFPSTHAATAFAAATILTAFNKKRRWLYYTVALLISYSRIYLGCHYFFDVLFGALLGYLISKTILLQFFPDTSPSRKK